MAISLPNQAQVLSALRWVVTVGGGFATTKGYLSSDQVTLILGVISTLVPLIFSFTVHTDSAKIAAVANIPDGPAKAASLQAASGNGP